MIIMSKSRISRLFAVFGTFALTLTACSGKSSPSHNTTSSDALHVATSFYPIQWLTQTIGGEAITVSSVTPANVEPHDYELSPKEILELDSKKILFYVKGFQPSLDKAADTLTSAHAVDLSPSAQLISTSSNQDTNDEHDEEHEHASHDTNNLDPHFWLDPQRMINTGQTIRDQLSQADPANAEQYARNFNDLKEKLNTLDTSFTQGLTACQRSTIVTTHASFGYMTQRYNIQQIALSGISPDSEPSPAVLAKIKSFIAENKTTTIFTETLVSPKVANALAAETGVHTDVLDPLESQPQSGDYLSSMESNLTALRKALSCSS